METTSKKSIGQKLVKDIGGKALWSLERLIARGSSIPDTPFISEEHFPWASRLEANHELIRSELENVLSQLDDIPNFQDISTDQVSITRDDNWKTFFLYGMGYKTERNCLRCPETTRLVESIPDMTTAFFSILSPGKHIPAHRGVYKGFVRYHLGLIVPEPKELCRIRVGDEIRYWEEGKSMFFDDTFDHEVWNDTNGTRVILFVDVKRPLRLPARLMNDGIIGIVRRTSYVTDAKKNQEEWDQRLATEKGRQTSPDVVAQE
ncbi:MAG: aspartyl/asparaginyl beta-hydroxylase domain-containing protein [Rhodothermales bacterium]|nr:aspartyl/asparaginyl beta-hydroxylase domain-containing protein [Rhodothermales bacterium]